MNNSLKKVSIIIVTYNNLNFTKKCLESIEKYSHYPNLEIIVIDNRSKDGTQAFLKNWQTILSKNCKKFIILNKENLGFSKANNQGLKLATGEYLVLLNNDTFVTPYWLHKLISHLNKNVDVGIIGPVTNNIGNEAKISTSYSTMSEMINFSKKYSEKNKGIIFDIKTLAFFCVMFKRELFKSVGFLDENFGLGFFEDDDYCRRIEKKGMRIVCAEDVFVHHHLSATFNKLDQSKRKLLFERNRKIYEGKWGKWVPHKYRSEVELPKKSRLIKLKNFIIQYIPDPIYRPLKKYIFESLFFLFPNSIYKEKYLELTRINSKLENNFLFSQKKFKPNKGKKDIFIFPNIDWSFRHQRPQHIAKYFESQGHRVFYFSAQFYNESKKPFKIFDRISDKIFLVSLSCSYPKINIYSSKISKKQISSLVFAVRALLSFTNSSRPIFIVNLPFWVNIIESPYFKNIKVLYDCMDHHMSFNNTSQQTDIDEKKLINLADEVIVSSKKLQENFSHVRQAHLIRNAADFEKFSCAEFARSNRPVVGYFGAISVWFDLELLYFLAQQKKGWDFILIGSCADVDISKFKKFTNVFFLGERQYDSLPSYLHGFDVAIIPFIINPLIEHTNPVKLYEYLSAGKPVVSTIMPELLLLDCKLVYLAESKYEFLKKLNVAMKNRKKSELIRARIRFAKRNSWRIRLKSFYRLAMKSKDKAIS